MKFIVIIGLLTFHALDIVLCQQSPWQFRLVDSNLAFKGRLEVNYLSHWIGICEYSFTNFTAALVCSALGSGRFSGGMIGHRYSRYINQALYRYLKCSASTPNRADCVVGNCIGYADVSISCYPTAGGNALYDGNLWKSRLIGGNKTTGLLQLHFNGYPYLWRSIHNNGFDGIAVEIACFTLGFSRSGKAIENNYVSSNNGSIWMFVMSCIGNESSLFDCSKTWTQTQRRVSEIVAISCTVMNPSIFNGGNRLLVNNSVVEPNNDLFGDDVLQRNISSTTIFSQSYRFTAWINTRQSLPRGNLTAFYVFVERYFNGSSVKKLQIWRPTSNNNIKFQLVWEKAVLFSNDIGRSALYKFNVSDDNFEVADGDRIGWINEDDATLFSVNLCIKDNVSCQCTSAEFNFENSYWPVVNQMYSFQCSNYVFSVAVEIQQDEVVQDAKGDDSIRTTVIIASVVSGVIIIIIIVLVIVLLIVWFKRRRRLSNSTQHQTSSENAYDLEPSQTNPSVTHTETSLSSYSFVSDPQTDVVTTSSNGTPAVQYAEVRRPVLRSTPVVNPTTESTYSQLSPDAGAAAIHYDSLWNVTNGQTSSAHQGQGHSDAGRRESGVSLVENTLYETGNDDVTRRTSDVNEVTLIDNKLYER